MPGDRVSPGRHYFSCGVTILSCYDALADGDPEQIGPTRLDRSGDRQLNRALHMILITRRRWHQPTIDYLARRRPHGKTSREATRYLKRYLARNLYRLLEHPPTTT